jgi:para-aminobenzoate synthetase component 1
VTNGGLRVILLEHGPGGPALFDGAEGLVQAHDLSEVVPALMRLDAARAAGKWVAGYLAYEAGYAFEPRLAGLPVAMGTPLLAFGIYDGPRPFAHPAAQSARLCPVAPVLARGAYDEAIGSVKAYIAAGDCYQVNLTFPLETRLLQGTALDLYLALRARQPVGFGAYVDLGGPVLVSRSPELFLRLDASGRIETRPMKGTAPRDPDPVEDALLAQALRASAKDRAENLMIVDLLRNDIARISKVGSVKVPELFHVESYATVHQMVSRITGQLAAPASLLGTMQALFPCGSITGAPKIRSMQIIAEVEGQPRGAYCGAIGWMAPDGAACFNVAIRTLTVTGDHVRLNVGGGVTHDSTADGEWEEALWKARYVMGLVSPG